MQAAKIGQCSGLSGRGQQFLTAWKSTDTGATWTEQDSGNRPETSQQLFTACQSTASGKILCSYADTGFIGFNLIPFDPSTDRWGTKSPTTNPPFNIIMSGIASVYRPADDTVLTGKSKGLWDEAEKSGKHLRLEPVNLEEFAVAYAFPRWLAAVTESLPEGQPLPNLADFLQEQGEKLLEQLCLPSNGE